MARQSGGPVPESMLVPIEQQRFHQGLEWRIRTMIAQISRRVRSRHGLLASLAAVAAVCVALSAHAAYESGSSDQDIKDSCKDFSVNTNGVLSANRNVWSSHGTVFDTRARTIDLDDKVGFDGSALQYNQTGFSDKCEDETVGLASDKLKLKATCSSKIVKIRIDDMMYNSGLSTMGETPGLYWRPARWSD